MLTVRHGMHIVAFRFLKGKSLNQFLFKLFAIVEEIPSQTCINSLARQSKKFSLLQKKVGYLNLSR